MGDRLEEIDPLALKSRLAQNRLSLIDVRSSSEYAEARIPGAILIPHTEIQPKDLPTDRAWVLYCRSGNRSAQAAERLLAAGLSTVTHLKGGILAWNAAGYETEH
ncbi:MAG TPA: rhodanese-like domain-containing protein [Chroococcidiopsis sp.]